jgi:hypothetical protein
MIISGFTMVRNATKLYYPVKQSIQSILPIVDEFVIALGDCDSDDHTLEEILSIHSDKIRIINTTWNLAKYAGGAEYAHQTDIAKEHCKGDWLFYLQSDEVIHENYLPSIQKKCTEFQNRPDVEGFLFNYRHFWGDYQHFIISHAWYNKEIRIIRNNPDIHSWRDAQSFRRIPDFDGTNYFQKENTFKLKVIDSGAFVYHYGWVRPPAMMQKKRVSFEIHMQGEEKAAELFEEEPQIFDYGNLDKLKSFNESHPSVMKNFIQQFNWRESLYPFIKTGIKHKHDRVKYRLLTFLEQNLLGGNHIAGFKNYELIRPGKINR